MSIQIERASGHAVQGHAEPEFAPVVEAFAENLAERDELGAAFAVVRDGRTVVDLWGGVADTRTGQPWRRDTLTTVFSQTKAWVAVCLLRLIDDGGLELDAPVARYWPEFAAAGKESVLVRDVVSHTSRLPALLEPATYDDMARPVEMAARLARQPLEADPRARFLYHGMTFGWLCGELVRRIDGRSAGRFLREEVCAPLGLDIWIGTPPAIEPRIAWLEYAADWGCNGGADEAVLAADDLRRRYWANPVLYPPERVIWNEPQLRAAEIAAVNGVGSARSIARLYDALVNGGGDGRRPLVSRATLARATQTVAAGDDPFSGDPAAFGVGFQLQTSMQAFGPVQQAFGHPGMGGSIHGAWPEHGIGFSYCMNRLRDRDPVDPRATALTTALAASLET